VLGHVDAQGQEHIVACISRSLNKYEKNYASYKGEMLAAVWAVRAFDYYLRGTPFKLVTDHSPLVFLMTNDGQYARWALILQEYNFTIAHRPGAKHQNADTLSRHLSASSADNTGARIDVEAGASSAVLTHPKAPQADAPGLVAHCAMSAFVANNPPLSRTAVELERQTLRCVRRDAIPGPPSDPPQGAATLPLPVTPVQAHGAASRPKPALAEARRSSRLVAALGVIGDGRLVTPPVFQLHTSAGMKEALHTLMPGPWTDGHATKLNCHVPGGRLFHQPHGIYHRGEPQRVATLQPEINELC
jgi:hypothetical protein